MILTIFRTSNLASYVDTYIWREADLADPRYSPVTLPILTSMAFDRSWRTQRPRLASEPVLSTLQASRLAPATSIVLRPDSVSLQLPGPVIKREKQVLIAFLVYLSLHSATRTNHAKFSTRQARGSTYNFASEAVQRGTSTRAEGNQDSLLTLHRIPACSQRRKD